MKLEQNDIDLAVDKKYTDFSNKVKDVLMVKLNDQEDIAKYKIDIDHLAHLKSVFSEINNKDKGE